MYDKHMFCIMLKYISDINVYVQTALSSLKLNLKLLTLNIFHEHPFYLKTSAFSIHFLKLVL